MKQLSFFLQTKKQALEEAERATSLKELDVVFRAYLGRKGAISLRLQELGRLSPDERRAEGRQLNLVKEELEDIFARRAQELRAREDEMRLAEEWIDVTAPGARVPRGHLHPLTRIGWEIEDIFASLGFAVATGPEMEDEWHNFDALNIPAKHPARDLWDTFWLRGNQKSQISNLKSQKLLMRTHTSPVQIRYMKEHQPPFRIIAPGRVFRHEATDASHNFQFYQVEGLMVGEDISVAHFKAVMSEFFERFFRKAVRIRLRPSFFPFVEPGFELDISCLTCGGGGCSVCSQSGWLEIMGAGMVHPKVFEAVGYNPQDVQGFAFGVGMDRLAMMKYKIDDIRLFYGGDLRFLEQF